ncbi:hypothetical protein [Halodesulfovibrio sp.]|jgi:hypothetical protein|uniref:hypothetical protein n=1 Tax=Halodesulfovibrio sp. TaxID=1912772 RepID=UPI0025E1A6C5|nr:hypothetical protein [Halodesulfovibrio sp.]
MIIATRLIYIHHTGTTHTMENAPTIIDTTIISITDSTTTTLMAPDHIHHITEDSEPEIETH